MLQAPHVPRAQRGLQRAFCRMSGREGRTGTRLSGPKSPTACAASSHGPNPFHTRLLWSRICTAGSSGAVRMAATSSLHAESHEDAVGLVQDGAGAHGYHGPGGARPREQPRSPNPGSASKGQARLPGKVHLGKPNPVRVLTVGAARAGTDARETARPEQ